MSARGFTLLELLIASALGALLIVATLSAYAQGRNLYQRAERIARLHERAAYTFSVLEPDVQLAGYYGFHGAAAGMRLVRAGTSVEAQALRRASAPVPWLPRGLHACASNFAVDVLTPLEASDQRYALACAASGGGAVALADTLTLRRAQVEPAAAAPGRLQLISSRLAPADQQLIIDGELPPGIALQPAQVELHDLAVHSYYVARNADGTPGLPALRVKSLSAIAGTAAFIDTEVMSGIEDLQVELGYRTDAHSDATPTYAAPGSVPAAARIVAARIWLRLRADEPDPGFADSRHYAYANQRFIPADHFLRVLVSRTIQLRNS